MIYADGSCPECGLTVAEGHPPTACAAGIDGECTHCGREIDSETGIDDSGSRRCDDFDPAHRYHQ